MTRGANTAKQPASDDHLTDHEWKLKMAAEGKAIYVPGKSVEEMLATESDGCRTISRRTVGLTAEEWKRLDTAIPDIIEVLRDVRNVLLDLSYSDDLDNLGVKSILRLAGRAVQSMENTEIQALDRLDMAVRASQEAA